MLLLLGPLVGEHLSSLFWRELDTKRLSRVGQDWIAFIRQISGSRQNSLIWCYPCVLKAHAVAHNKIGIGDGCAEEDNGSYTYLVTVFLGFHDVARSLVAQNHPTFFDLDQARKDLGGRGRLAIHQHDEFAAEMVMANDLDDLRFLRISPNAVGDLHIVFKYVADQITKRIYNDAGITAQVQNQGLVVTRFADDVVQSRFGKRERGEFQDHQVITHFGVTDSHEMLLIFHFTQKRPDAVTGHILNMHKLGDLCGYIKLALIAPGVAQIQMQSRQWLKYVEPILYFPEIVPNGGIAVDRQHLVSGPYIFGISVAVGTHADNIAAVADHLRLPAVVVAVRIPQSNKKGVGVVQGIQPRRRLTTCPADSPPL